MRPIDADALMGRLSRKKSELAAERYTAGFNDCLLRVRSMVHSAPTVTAAPDELYKNAVDRLGEFGQLFLDYEGDPRGPAGRPAVGGLKAEILAMPVITDVDGGRWRPVNEDALRELLAKMDELVAGYVGEDWTK